MSTIRRPAIGVTLDSEQPGGYSKYPWYAIRQNYADAIVAAGGLPIALPHDATLAAEYLDRIDALVVTGGAFDVDPALYGDGARHATVTLKEGRTAAELALTNAALERDMPVLGICGGEQLLAVALGGTLIQHIPDSITDALDAARIKGIVQRGIKPAKRVLQVIPREDQWRPKLKEPGSRE